jgi:hypothetical protein
VGEIIFYTINEVIKLDSETEEETHNQADAGVSAPAGRSRYESVMVSLKDPPPEPQEQQYPLLRNPDTGQYTRAAATAAAAAALAKEIMTVGQRVQISFMSSADPDDTLGKSFGG